MGDEWGGLVIYYISYDVCMPVRVSAGLPVCMPVRLSACQSQESGYEEPCEFLGLGAFS